VAVASRSLAVSYLVTKFELVGTFLSSGPDCSVSMCTGCERGANGRVWKLRVGEGVDVTTTSRAQPSHLVIK